MVERGGFEPPKAEPADLQSAPFDRSGTSPQWTLAGASEGNRTPDPLITNQLLCHLSYAGFHPVGKQMQTITPQEMKFNTKIAFSRDIFQRPPAWLSAGSAPNGPQDFHKLENISQEQCDCKKKNAPVVIATCVQADDRNPSEFLGLCRSSLSAPLPLEPESSSPGPDPERF